MDISEFATEWLNAESISNQKEHPTEATILNEGELLEGKFGKKPVFTVEIEGRKVKYRPSKTAIRTISKKYGTDTMKWVYHKIELVSMEQMFKDGIRKTVVVV